MLNARQGTTVARTATTGEATAVVATDAMTAVVETAVMTAGVANVAMTEAVTAGTISALAVITIDQKLQMMQMMCCTMT
jgi:hypothetical protein